MCKINKSMNSQLLGKAIEKMPISSDYEEDVLNRVISLRSEKTDPHVWVNENCLCNHNQDITQYGSDVLEYDAMLSREIANVRQEFGL